MAKQSTGKLIMELIVARGLVHTCQDDEVTIKWEDEAEEDINVFLMHHQQSELANLRKRVGLAEELIKLLERIYKGMVIAREHIELLAEWRKMRDADLPSFKDISGSYKDKKEEGQ